MDFDIDDLKIEPIDTTREIPKAPREMVKYIIELQGKVNELVEIINILTIPDDQEALDDEDEDSDGEVIGKPVPKPSRK